MEDAGVRLMIGPTSRELRRLLRPIEWVVLEDVALDARADDDGILVAPTSARRVAEHLGLTPGAAARALGRLRSAGLLTYSRQTGPAGRFGLSAYVLGSIPGLGVLSPAEAPENAGPHPAPPHPAAPHVASPRAVERHMVAAGTSGPHGGEAPRRSVHEDATAALATAADDLAAEERARPSAGGLTALRRPLSLVEAAAQLTIFDATDDCDSDNRPRRRP